MHLNTNRPMTARTGLGPNAAKPQGMAQRVSQRLPSTLIRSAQEKFKAGGVKAGPGIGMLDGASSFRMTETGESADSALGTAHTLQGRKRVAGKFRRPKKMRLDMVDRIAPGLGEAATDAPASQKVGKKSGLKGVKNGGGLLGAIVQRNLGADHGAPISSRESGTSGKTQAMLNKVPFFISKMGQGVHGPQFIAAAPSPKRFGRMARSAAEIGKNRLRAGLTKASGKVALFLKNSPTGGLIRSVEGMRAALAPKETERLKLGFYAGGRA